MTEVQITDGADVPGQQWDAYVESHPDATPYHQAAWLRVIGRAFGHETRWISAEREGRVTGVLPLVVFRSRLFGRFVVSLPFVNYGGVLASDPASTRLLIDRAITIARASEAAHLELRHTGRVDERLVERTHKVAMVLPLAREPAEQWQRLDRKVRNLVRKAEREGVTSSVGGPELVDDFYDVFATSMRDLGTPVYPRRFFHQVLHTFPESTRVYRVVVSDRTVGASIVVQHRDHVEVPWASTLRDYHRVSANMLLYWTMLGSSIERGAKTFDFGRSTRGGGTFRFKQQWGAEPRPLVWEYWLPAGRAMPDLSPDNPRFRRVIQLWKHLPVALTRTIGPAIVRNIP